ncbi:MAG: exo-beta-N-acetylmuramidase NamZ family protein [Thermodesulfobacteriota bacterium]
MTTIATGLDQFEEEQLKRCKGQNLGLLSNQASVDHTLTNAKDVISALLPGDLKVLFGPQHGFRGEDQDNMVETEDYLDPQLQIPVVSLYGNKMDRLSDILDTIDLLIIDLQDVGTRVYTFISTLLSCLKKAGAKGKEVLVLDRPNPLGGIIVEGNLLRPEFHSLVGPFALPMRHGMTIGELAYLFNDAMKVDCDITVLPLKGWYRRMLWNDTGLRWIMPSPNMPLFETALVYPGQVIWEGTNISEGRGTCRPFEICGAPFINPSIIKKELALKDIEGCYLQEYYFRPTFNKWKSKLCGGFMIHIIDPKMYRPYRTSLALLRITLEIYRDKFIWKKPPYEYEFNKLPIDLIFGDSSMRLALETGKKFEQLLKSCSKELEGFLESRKPYLLYEE